LKTSRNLKKRKKALLRGKRLFEEKKGSKKSAIRGIPPGALRGNWSHVCAPRKCEEGVAVHLLHDLPLFPGPRRDAWTGSASVGGRHGQYM